MSVGDSCIGEAHGHDSPTAIRRRKPGWTLPVLSGVLLYLLLYLLFLPPIFVISDERGYLQAANNIMTGKVLDRQSSAYRTKEQADGFRPFRGRSFGFSAILACLLPFGWKATYAVGLICHLVTFLSVAYLCRELGRSPWWAWLVLLHPTLALFSRTIMTDVPSATAVAVVLVLLSITPRRPAAAGVIAGLALFLRITNCWLGLAVGVQLLFDDLTRQKGRHVLERLWRGDLKRFLLSYSLLCVALLVQNTLIYGGPFKTSYTGVVSDTGFALRHLVAHLPVYLVALNVFWPAMIVAVWFLPGSVRLFAVTLVASQLIFFSSYFFLDTGINHLETLVRGQRFLVGSIVVLCAAYPALVESVVRKRRIPMFMAVIAILSGVGATVAMFRKHSLYMARQLSVVRAAYSCTTPRSTVYVGPNASELFCEALGERTVRYALDSFIKQSYQDVRPGDLFAFYIQPPPRNLGHKQRASERLIADLGTIAELTSVCVPPEARALRVFKVESRRPGAYLAPLSDSEVDQIFPWRKPALAGKN